MTADEKTKNEKTIKSKGGNKSDSKSAGYKDNMVEDNFSETNKIENSQNTEDGNSSVQSSSNENVAVKKSPIERTPLGCFFYVPLVIGFVNIIFSLFFGTTTDVSSVPVGIIGIFEDLILTFIILFFYNPMLWTKVHRQEIARNIKHKEAALIAIIAFLVFWFLVFLYQVFYGQLFSKYPFSVQNIFPFYLLILIASFEEELMVKGVWYRYFSAKIKNKYVIRLIICTCFTLLHFSNSNAVWYLRIIQLSTIFLIQYLSLLLFEVKQSIWLCFLFHLIYNLIVVML